MTYSCKTCGAEITQDQKIKFDSMCPECIRIAKVADHVVSRNFLTLTSLSSMVLVIVGIFLGFNLSTSDFPSGWGAVFAGTFIALAVMTLCFLIGSGKSYTPGTQVPINSESDKSQTTP